MTEGIFESTSFELSTVTLISSVGYSTDIKFMVQDLNIYEDIFANCMSGELEIKDSQNIIKAFQLHGNEYIHIKFETPSLNAFERYFRIYKIADIKQNNLSSYTYKIYFCTDDFILNQQVIISKSYKNQIVTDIVKDLLLNQLKVNKNRVLDRNFEPTKNNQNIIIPFLRPMEAINWLSVFSINEKLSSAFFLYETHEGYNFRSLASIFDDSTFKTIHINAKNVIENVDNKVANRFAADRFEVKQQFDILETISSGGMSGYMMAIDLTTRQHVEKQFNPITNNVKKLNEFLPFNDSLNRLDLSIAEGSGFVRYFPAFQGNLVDKWLLQRAAQVSAVNSFRMSLQLAGDSELTVGKIIEMDIPSLEPVTESQEIQIDGMKSGRFLVTQVRHRIYNNKYFNYVELCKDSNLEGIGSYVKTPLYDIAKKS